MSTYMYLECLDHDPPLNSDGEVGQHTYDLPDIRKYVAQRDLYVELMKQDMPVSFDSHWVHAAARFLWQHPRCNIGIVDEYDRKYSLVGDSRDPEPEAEPEPEQLTLLPGNCSCACHLPGIHMSHVVACC